MDTELYQEKMNKNHRECLCRMLNVKQLPDEVLARYDEIKRLVDRVDAFLSPADLAFVIVLSSKHPEVCTTLIYNNHTEEELTEDDDKVIEEAIEEPADLQLNEQFSGAIGQEPSPTGEIPWSSGMPVTVLLDDEIKNGKIFAVHSDDEPAQLTVTLDGGETVTVNEEDVEAI